MSRPRRNSLLIDAPTDFVKRVATSVLRQMLPAVEMDADADFSAALKLASSSSHERSTSAAIGDIDGIQLPYAILEEELLAAFELFLHCALFKVADSNGSLVENILRRLVVEEEESDQQEPLRDSVTVNAIKNLFQHHCASLAEESSVYSRLFSCITQEVVSDEVLILEKISASWDSLLAANCQENEAEATQLSSRFSRFFESVKARKGVHATTLLLQECLQTNIDAATQIHLRVSLLSSRKFLRQELQNRIESVESHPFFNAITMGSESRFQDWRRAHVAQLHDMLQLHSKRKSLLVKEKQLLGRLEVQIHRAHDLSDEDLGHSHSDPYVRVKFAGKRGFTPVVRDDPSPVWECSFWFWHYEGAKELVEIDVRDKDMGPTFNSLGGSIHVQLDSLISMNRSTATRQWASISKRANNSRARLCYSMRYCRWNPNITACMNHHILFRLTMHKMYLAQGRRLSHSSVAVLLEFAKRYHISDRFRSLCLLQIVSLSLFSVDDLEPVGRLLKNLADELSELNIIEKTMWDGSLPRIVSFCEEELMKFNWESINSVLELLLVELHVSNERINALIENGINQMYQRQTAEPSKIQQIVTFVSKFLRVDSVLLEEQFARSDVSFIKQCSAQLSNLLMDTLEGCDLGDNLSVTFHVYRICRDLHLLLLERGIVFPCARIFAPAISQTLSQLSTQLLLWTKESLRLNLHWGRISESHLHTSTVVDLYSELYDAVEFIEELQWHIFVAPNAEVVDFFVIFVAQCVAPALRFYVECVARAFNEEMDGHRLTGEFLVEESMLAKINDIYICRKHFGELLERIGEPDHPSVSRSWELLNSVYSSMIERVSDAVEDRVLQFHHSRQKKRKQWFLSRTSDSEDDQRVEDNMKRYINGQLALCARLLYSHVFRKLMTSVWSRIARDLHVRLCATDDEDQQQQYCDLHAELQTVFGGADSLIPRNLKESSDRVHRVLGMRLQETTELCSDFYSTFKVDAELASLILHHLHHRYKANPDDVEARLFVRMQSELGRFKH